ncbi:hypothetical protein G7081_05825 [Vagococcus coleopterorum]|uniref:Uncharacterized protein n=1 Tax=Vagococcus coleopterorum TaxID=2714946 RepID=A0A6G8ANH8_9ENTE|nr:hypothetical protein [Vagococcus coleopterorum]QIL46628.1 hypothetical protein G7081_05825 [Vagococcus coleopterorum]
MGGSILQYGATMALYIIILMLIVEFMRKNYRFASWFWLATLLTFPLWIMSGGVDGWFRWFKILSVILPTIVLGFARVANADNKMGEYWESLKKNWMLWFLYGILFLNILEATIKDIEMGNYLNAFAGFVLCLTIPYAPKFWELENKPNGDLLVYTTVMWNFLYTTWNAAFVYAEGATFFASSICILLAAELYPIIKRRPELYVIARVYTLATHLLIRALAPTLFPQIMNSTTWFNPEFLKYWGTFNFIIAIPFVFWHTWQLHTGKSEQSFRRIKAK